MYESSEVLNSPLGRELLASNSAFDAAAMAGKLAQSYFGQFSNDMHKIFGPEVKVNHKDNILRIAEKIKEISKEKQINK